MSHEEILRETKLRQAQAWKDTNGRDFERIDNQAMREAKRKMDAAERRYNYFNK